MKLFLLLVFIVAMTPDAGAIVIRHDVEDAKYHNRTTPIPALVTFTALHEGKTFVVGSGTYLGSGWVLTAAHVAHFLQSNNKAELNSEQLNIIDSLVHEQWQDQHIGFDIALVKVSEPGKEVTPVRLFADSLAQQDIVILAGRGDSGNGLTGIQPPLDSKIRVAENRINKIAGQWISFTFDSPENGALDFEGVSGGGDSGSPAYIIQDGEYHVVGISSWQDTEATNWQQGFYGAIDHYTNILYFRDWLIKHLSAKQ